MFGGRAATPLAQKAAAAEMGEKLMSKPLWMIASCLALSCAATFASALETSPDKQEVLSLALRGVHFVPNHGQWADADVHFGLRSRGLDVAFRESAFTMHLARQTGSESRDRNDELTPRLDPMLPHGGDSPGDRANVEHLTLTVSFPGSNRVMPEGGEPQTAKFNFFVGGEGREVATDVPSFGAVVYHNLYDGVDLHVMGSDEGVLKYEFHVAPGADYEQIRISYDGIESLCIDDSGDLRIETAFGTLADRAPLVWQELDGDRTDVTARFEVCDERTYRIAADGEVDGSRALVIDPDVEWMYYLGGSEYDYGGAIALDGAGNVLIAGVTESIDFEGRNNVHYGSRDVFLVRTSPSGELNWMTYLGGSGNEYSYGIAMDSTGNALVTGDTFSTDFAGRNNSHHGGSGDTFVLKVNPSGELEWMTYLGGEKADLGRGIAVDAVGNALVTGRTFSTDFEGRSNSYYGGFWDAFVLGVSPSGQIQWMTYFGGSGDDNGAGIAVDGSETVLVAGYTGSVDFDGRTNSYYGGEMDAYALKFSLLGEIQWMTYLGGSGVDWCSGIAVDGDGNALVVGYAESTDFAGQNNSHHGGRGDAIALKLNPSGQLQWMTYIGGNREEGGRGVAIDGTGAAIVTGETDSTTFEGRINSFFGGSWDVFTLRVSPSGQLEWMTYLGGSSSEVPSGIALDSARRALVTGNTHSADFSGQSNSPHGQSDAFIVNLRVVDGPELLVDPTCPSGGPIRVSWTNATPDGRVVLLFARNTGSFVIPNGRPCAGTALGLGSNQLQIVFQGSAGPEGARTLNSNTGSGACGGHLQLLDIVTCTTSNVATIE